MSEAGLTLSEVCWSLRWGCSLANRFRLETLNWGAKPEGHVEPRKLYWSPVSLDSQGSAATAIVNIVPANRSIRVGVWLWLPA